MNFYEANLDICKRFNLTYKMWDSRGRENKIFKIFLKYEFRHLIINSLRKNDFNTIKLFLENIDKDILTVTVLSYERIVPVWMAKVKLPNEFVEQLRVRRRLYNY